MFEAWKHAVDNEFLAYTGGQCIADDMPDFLWHDAYKDGYSPAEAFECYLETYPALAQ